MARWSASWNINFIIFRFFHGLFPKFYELHQILKPTRKQNFESWIESNLLGFFGDLVGICFLIWYKNLVKILILNLLLSYHHWPFITQFGLNITIQNMRTFGPLFIQVSHFCMLRWPSENWMACGSQIYRHLGTGIGRLVFVRNQSLFIWKEVKFTLLYYYLYLGGIIWQIRSLWATSQLEILSGMNRALIHVFISKKLIIISF